MSMRRCLLEAARILSEVRAKKGAVKALVLTSPYSNKRQLLAIVCEVLKYNSILQEVIRNCGIYGDDEHLSMVLLYEHLVGHGLRNAGSIRKIVTSKREEIKEFVSNLLAQRGVDSLQELLPADCRSENGLQLPRYARVNTLKMSCADICSRLAEDGWVLCKALDLRGWLDSKPSENHFIMDPLLQNVLVFPPGTELHDHALCLDGCLILQDRASCFPAQVLQPRPHSVTIDCCAAPGNKTTHMASLMQNTGTVYAFDRDAKRVQTLRSMLSRAGVTNTQVACQDFLTVSPTQPPYCQAQAILLDPSCSGSGMIGRMNHLTDDRRSTNPSRLSSLSRFQISLLKHALSFPRVQRVVYSTCSIHAEENEAVVQEVLNQVQGSFALKKVLPRWPRRGLHEFECGPWCVRTNPQEDLTNGFFVACFERKRDNADKELDDCADESSSAGGVDLAEEDDESACAHLSGKKSRKLENGKKRKKKKRTKSEEGFKVAVTGRPSGSECVTAKKLKKTEKERRETDRDCEGSDGVVKDFAIHSENLDHSNDTKVQKQKKKKKKKRANEGRSEIDGSSNSMVGGHKACSEGLADGKMEKTKTGKKKKDKRWTLETKTAAETAVAVSLQGCGQDFEEEAPPAKSSHAPQHGSHKKKGKKRKGIVEVQQEASRNYKKMRM